MLQFSNLTLFLTIGYFVYLIIEKITDWHNTNHLDFFLTILLTLFFCFVILIVDVTDLQRHLLAIACYILLIMAIKDC